MDLLCMIGCFFSLIGKIVETIINGIMIGIIGIFEIFRRSV